MQQQLGDIGAPSLNHIDLAFDALYMYAMAIVGEQAEGLDNPSDQVLSEVAAHAGNH